MATYAEVAALMWSVALQGFPYGQDYVTPRACLMVAEYVIEHMGVLSRPLDMRLFVNGVLDYLQNKTGHSRTDWRDLIETRLRETTIFRGTN